MMRNDTSPSRQAIRKQCATEFAECYTTPRVVESYTTPRVIPHIVTVTILVITPRVMQLCAAVIMTRGVMQLCAALPEARIPRGDFKGFKPARR